MAVNASSVPRRRRRTTAACAAALAVVGAAAAPADRDARGALPPRARALAPPAACSPHGWHPEIASGRGDGCADDAVHPPEWAAPAMRDMMFFATFAACCAAFFPGGGPGECVAYAAGCGGAGEGAAAGGADAGGGGGGGDCAWHVDVGTNDGCTNDDQYPEAWLLAPGMKEMVFHRTPEACCQMMFPTDECPIYDRGCTTNVLGDGGGGSGGDGVPVPTPPPAVPTPPPPAADCAWHPDQETQDGCSNDDNYPAAWLEGAMLDVMFHATHAACCDVVFKQGDCTQHERGCTRNVLGGGGVPTTPLPAVPPSAADCAWHPDAETQDGCTNDDHYPAEWLDDAMLDVMFHATHAACCDVVFGQDDCTRHERGCTRNVLGGGGGVPTTALPAVPSPGADPAPTPPPANPPPAETPDCVTPGWHAEMESGNRDGCSDDAAFPQDWLAMKDSMFFPTSQECCDIFFKGRNCIVYERGCRIDSSPAVAPKEEAPKCEGSVFHPDTRNPGCSNSVGYPETWDGDEKYVFGSAQACCEEYHEQDGRCAVRNGCTDKVVYLQITQPTKKPTKQPTTNPSKSPTPQPSVTPTVRPPAYYVRHTVGTCVDDRIVPRPYYITETYTDMHTCCNFSFLRDKCMLQMQNDGYTLPPSLHTDSVVTITAYGSLRIEGLTVPDSFQEWRVLKKVLEKSLYSIMTKSPLCHPELSVILSMYGGRSFPEKNDKKRFLEVTQETEEKQQRRATALETLQFEMVILARCDEACQVASGPPGQLAFKQIESHFQQYIETGVMSSTLGRFGDAYDLFDIEEEAPKASSGTLTYHQGVASSMTWVPTFSPTGQMPTPSPIRTWFPTLSPTQDPTEKTTEEPTSFPTTGVPTLSPTKSCVTQQWNYKGDGKCTNSRNYPKLWDIEPWIGEHFLFDTLEDCCAVKSPEWCVESNVCEVTPAATVLYCRENVARYHPTTPSERTCTNSKDYPTAWDVQNDRFLFVSAQDCCAEFYGDGACFIKDVCS